MRPSSLDCRPRQALTWTPSWPNCPTLVTSLLNHGRATLKLMQVSGVTDFCMREHGLPPDLVSRSPCPDMGGSSVMNRTQSEHRHMTAACSVTCKCQSVSCPRSAPIVIHACIHSLTPKKALDQACGVEEGTQTWNCPLEVHHPMQVFPTPQLHLKITTVVGTQTLMRTRQHWLRAETGVAVKVPTEGPHAHLPHDDLQSLSPSPPAKMRPDLPS